MNIGRLKHRIKLQEQQQIQDPNTGAITTEWVDMASVWASVEGINGREFVAAASEQATVTWRITIRYREIQPTWRIVFDDKYFNIKAVLPNNDQSQLVLMCETGANDG